jgi:hypothetical protein
MALIRIAVSARPYCASLSGSIVYPPERSAISPYLLWPTEVEANTRAVLRRPGESYSEAVPRLAKEQD